MTAEVSNILAQLSVIQREIINPQTGQPIVSFENVPYVINTADMPLFVNFAGPLTNNALIGSDDLARDFNETRIYNMLFYLAPYGTGVEGEKTGLLTPYFSLVYMLFGKYPHLKQLPGALDARLAADSGTSTLQEFIGQKYFGIRFSLQVTSKVRRPLGSDE